MNPVTSSAPPPPAPPLHFALWSLRSRMKHKSEETLQLVQDLGFSSVELAGFFDKTTTQLDSALRRHGFRVCSVHGPSITLEPERNVKFYVDWAIDHLKLFGTGTLAMESTSSLFPERFKQSDWLAQYGTIIDLVVKIARELKPLGFQVSYHCFLHDLRLLPGVPLVERLFNAKGCPDNLGLQLDTFWLHRARLTPRQIAGWPIHSMHLNERDDHGHCCPLGTRRERCADYVRAVAASGQSVIMILENDPCDADADDPSEPHVPTITHCAQNWKAFWNSAVEADATGATEPQRHEVSLQDSGAADKPARTVGREVGDVYQTEVSEAMTEDLLGNSKDLYPLDRNDPRVQFYIKQRKLSESSEGDAGDYRAEIDMMNRFLPDSQDPTVIQVIGGGGSGKSTFLRYFFQYFLPHREFLMGRQPPDPLVADIHAKAVRKHIVLYANLRRPDPENLRRFVLERVTKSLIATAERIGLTAVTADASQMDNDPERWVKKHITNLAKEIEGGLRKWFISLVLDNTDQLDEATMGKLVNLLHEFIREEQPHEPANQPVTAIGRALWRVIIPIRPETKSRLTRHWRPFKNKKDFPLNPIKHDYLVESRANLLDQIVKGSDRPLCVNIWFGDVPRPEFDLKTPTEVAVYLQKMLRAANGLPGVQDAISGKAREVLNQLANDSARGRLDLLRRAAFARPFRERYTLGSQRGWDEPVSDRYFYESLLCGDKGYFDPFDDSCLLNLYALGADPASARSTLVGVHAVCLLSRKMEWSEVRTKLESVGYKETDLKKCERWLEDKETIKRMDAVEHYVEWPIVHGHWSLLKERAYTDNMAASCAQLWGQPERALKTDPLDFSEILPQLKSSLWFLQTLWEKEKEMAHDYKSGGLQKKDFVTALETLKLPWVTGYVAREYLDRMRALPDYAKPNMAIAQERVEWSNCLWRLEKLIEESTQDDYLQPRR